MKKKILTLILPAVAMITAACGEQKSCDHKDENHDHICDVCNEKISEHKDDNKDHKCDVCEQSMGEHADKNNDHKCDYCGESMSEHKDENKDHKCDICGASMGEHADKDNDHNCDYCGEKISDHKDDNKDHKCDICGQSMGEHADHNNDHNCDYCGEKLSDHADSNHDHKCDVCGEAMGEHADNNNDHMCDYCGEKVSEHTEPNEEGKCDICGEQLVPPTPENKELEKFNELVASIKKNHNYTLTINSVVQGLEDQELNCHRYNLNNKAWFHDNSEYFEAEGIIFQKGQGYITFAKNVDYIVPMSLADDFTYEKDPRIFVSTNPALNISDFTDVIGENLFIGDYTQDSTDKTKFSSTSIDNRAVAAYLTQYYDYISTGQLQISDKINAVVDVNNSKITLNLEYTLWYFDEVEVEAPGSISITLEDVGTTSDEVISAYIANPSYTFEAPTSWPEGMSSIFAELYNSVNPTIPSGLSYATVCEKILYDGFYYAGIQDLNSGDLRASYGETLLSEGFTKVSDNSYKKVVINGVDSVTYKVIMKYDAASTLYPNGEMKILFRADKSSGVFASIADFNAYLSSKKYDELVPSLPNEDSCTSISNFKDTTDNETYALKCNSTDTFKVNIPDYTKAQSFVNSYVNALVAKGFSDTSKFLSMTNYSLEWSTAGSYVAIDFPATAGQYSGYVGIRYVVYKVDEQSLRPSAKHSVSASSSIENGSISFGGTTEYSAGSTVNFTITPNSGYEFDSASIVGKDIQVNVVGNKGSFVMPDDDVVVLVTFKEKAPEPTHAISFVCDHFTVDHFEDEGGNVITSYIYKEDAFGIFAYGSFDEGFEFDYLTLEGDEEALGASWFDEDRDCDVIQIYPSKALDEYNITAYTKGSSPEPTKYDVSVDTSIDGGSIMNIVVNGESSTQAEAGDTVRFTVLADDNYVLVGDSVKVFDEDGQEVSISLAFMSQSTYTFTMPSSNVTITAEFEADIPAPTHAISFEADHTSDVAFYSEGLDPITKFESGDGFMIYMHVEAGYQYASAELEGDSAAQIYNWDEEGYFVLYVIPSKVLDEYNVSAVFEAASPEPTSYSISVDSSITGGSIKNIVVNGSASTEAEAGDTVRFTVSANEDYKIVADSVKVTDGDGNPVSISLAPMSTSSYTFTMPSSNVTITAEFEADIPEPTMYAINKDTIEGATIKVAGMISEAEEGEVVKFSVDLEDGYTLNSVSIKDHPEIQIDESVNPFTGATTYMFDMPAFDVTISADVLEPAPAKAWHVEADSSIENGSITFAESYYDTDEKVEFTVTPDSGYEIESVTSNPSVTITDEGDGKYSFNMPAGDVVVSATFKEQAGPAPVESVTYYAQVGSVTKYNLTLTINSDGTAVYSYEKNGSGVVKEFKLNYTRDGDVLTITYAESYSFKSTDPQYIIIPTTMSSSTITLGDGTATFNTYYDNGGTPVERVLSIVK